MGAYRNGTAVVNANLQDEEALRHSVDALNARNQDNPEVISGVDNRTKRRGSLTITIGLPASGKSTWAEGLRAQFPDRVRIVNRDDIRATTGARFEDGDEGWVALVRDYTIDQLLLRGYDVICTDTNISQRVRRHLAGLAKHRKAEFSEVVFNTPLSVCLERNQLRWLHGDEKVPNSAITRMFEQWTDRPILPVSLENKPFRV